jgi:hexosaminidase
MEFENSYFLPNELLSDGYSLINASWTPLYVVNRQVWPARKVYEWDLGKFGKFSNLYPTTSWFRTPDVTNVRGAQICSWEGPEATEIQNLRRIVPAMAERVWNPSARSTYEQFEARLSRTEKTLDRLIHPVSISHGALDAVDPSGFDVSCFSKKLQISLSAAKPGIVRFTLDGKAPRASSQIYSGPITLTQTTTVRTALFGPSGQRLGYESSGIFYHVPPHMPNLATGKKVTVSGGTQGPQAPELAVDDNLELGSSWWASPGPQWLQVDLGNPFNVDRIELFPYWDGSRSYQYTVEVSLDGKAWSIGADRKSNTKPASAEGDEIRFGASTVRFVKVNMLCCSANEGVHVVELRVWPAK